MSSCVAKVQTSVALPPDLLARVNAVAESAERSRSYVVSRALEAFCDALESPPSGATSGLPPGNVAGGVAPSAPSGAPYPASLHTAALRRGAAVHTERAAVAAVHHDRVLTETAESLKGLTK